MALRLISEGQLPEFLAHPRLQPWADAVAAAFDGFYEDAPVVVMDHDVHIAGDLDDAWLAQLHPGLVDGILVVDGDLSVEGDIVSVHDPLAAFYPERSYGEVALVVRGDLRCRSLFCGRASPVIVAGTARVSEMVAIHDDHCPFVFAALRCPVVTLNQWNLYGDFAEVGLIRCEAVGRGAEWPELTHGDCEVFVPQALQGYGVMDEAAVRLRKGESLLTEGWASCLAYGSVGSMEPGRRKASPVKAVADPSAPALVSAPKAGLPLAEQQSALLERIQRDPKNLEAVAALALLRLRVEGPAAAREVLASVDAAGWGQTDGRLEQVWLSVRAAEASPEATGRSESQMAFDRAMDFASAEAWERALETLLTIVQRDRAFGGDLARTAMLRIFDVLGKDAPLTMTWRRRLAQTLF